MTTTINKTNFSFKNTTIRALSLLMLAFTLFLGATPTNIHASNTDFTVGKNGEVTFNVGEKGQDIWQKIGTELQTIIGALSGIATVVMVGMCLFNMVKVATAGTNSKARTEAVQAVGWTLAAAFGLGSVTLWVALAMNTGENIKTKKSDANTIKSITTVASSNVVTTLEELNLTM